MKIITLFFLLLFLNPIFSQEGVEWAKSYGTENNDNFSAMVETDDGNILSVGFKKLPDDNKEVLLYKINLAGDVIWENTLAFPNTNLYLSSIIHTHDNSGYLIGGSIWPVIGGTMGKSDYLLIKVDELGNELWRRTYGGSEHDHLSSIATVTLSSSSFYILGGTSRSNDGDITSPNGEDDFWVVYVDNAGEIIIEKSYGGTESDQLHSMVVTSDNEVILSGSSHSFVNEGSNADFWIVKTELSGPIIWSKSYGGTGSDFSAKIIEVENKEFIFAGYSNSNDFDVQMDNHGAYDFVAGRINKDGDLIWIKSYGGSAWEFLYEIEAGFDSTIYLGGFTRSKDGDVTNRPNGGTNDYWIVAIDKDSGEIIWQNNYGGSGADTLIDLLIVKDNLYVGGYSYSNDIDIAGDNSGRSDLWILKLEQIETSPEIFYTEPLILLPNPTQNYLNITHNPSSEYFIIYDLLGREIMSDKIINDRIDVRKLESGTYFLKMLNKTLKINQVAKFVKI